MSSVNFDRAGQPGLRLYVQAVLPRIPAVCLLDTFDSFGVALAVQISIIAAAFAGATFDARTYCGGTT
jgi:hypothetical protein